MILAVSADTLLLLSFFQCDKVHILVIQVSCLVIWWLYLLPLAILDHQSCILMILSRYCVFAVYCSDYVLWLLLLLSMLSVIISESLLLMGFRHPILSLLSMGGIRCLRRMVFVVWYNAFCHCIEIQ